jgi:predicted peptidase
MGSFKMAANSYNGGTMRARTLVRGMLAAGLTIGLQLATTQIPVAQQTTPSGAPPTEAPQPNRGGGRGAVDPRVQQRTYMFEDSNEQMPYALFVSSKVNKDKKNPLIVSLHGLGGDQNTMVRESLDVVQDRAL